MLPGNGQAQLRGLNLPVSLTSETIDSLPHGLYLPSDTALITTGRGYPVGGVLGMLEVVGYVTGTGLMQRYTTLEATPRVFTRAFTSAWSAWVQVGGKDAPLPMMSAWITTSAAIASGTNTITGWTERVDTASAFVPSTGIYTAPAAGYYAINLNASFATQSTRRMLQLEAGGVIVARAEGAATAYSSLQVGVDCWYLAANDTVLPRAYAAAAATIRGDQAPATFSVRYLGPTP